MNRVELNKRVRVLARDFNNATFRDEDINNFINEGIDRVMQVIPQFENMQYLTLGTDEPMYLPKAYHHLLAIYGASRCFYQDERHFQAGNMMNEFEVKLDDLLMKIQSGEIEILDENGEVIEILGEPEYVTNIYYHPFRKKKNIPQEEEGVEVE